MSILNEHQEIISAKLKKGSDWKAVWISAWSARCFEILPRTDKGYLGPAFPN
jgi:hypothetical protein